MIWYNKFWKNINFQNLIPIFYRNCKNLSRIGLLAQLAERGANNAKVVSSILTQAKIFLKHHQMFNNDCVNFQHNSGISNIVNWLTIF